MRLGILANTIETGTSLASGGHVHFIEVARRLHDVELTVFAPALAAQQLKQVFPDANIVALPSCERFVRSRAIVFLFRSAAALVALRELRRCDVLWATSHFLPDVVPAMTRRATSVVCIHHIIDDWRTRSGSRLNNLIAYCAERVALRIARVGAQAVIAGSDYVFHQLRAMGFRQYMQTTTNGANHIDPGSAGAAARSGALYIGRLHPTKGIEDLLRAWKLVSNMLPGQNLTIVGDGEAAYVESLRRLAESLGLKGSVRFAGYVDDATKLGLLRSSRVFAFASKEEGWGIAIAEALSAGLPCVTYDLPVFRGLFDRGRVFAPPANYEEFARKIVTLLDNDEQWATLSKDALESSREFTWERAAAVERGVFLFALGKNA